VGKLAERLGDAQRSGVYRIEVTEALEEAVTLNGFALERIALEEMPGGALASLAASAAGRGADGRVLLFTGFEPPLRAVPDVLEALLASLAATAAASRARRERFFAVFLDPGALLALAPLYRWRRSAAA
jgi:hypothetical protein